MKGKVISLVLAAAMAISLFSGCGGSEGTASSDSTLSSGTTQPGETQKENGSTAKDTDGAGTQTGEVKTGGIFKAGTPQEVTKLGYTPDISGNSGIMYLNCAYESLLNYDSDGGLCARLATEWSTDPEAATLTYKLRDGVLFSDGTAFNAEAVKWNIEQYQKVGRTEVVSVDSVECPDDLTVVVHLTEWNSAALESIGFYVYYMSPTAIEENGAEWAQQNTVGTGPFVLDSYEPGGKISYKKNENYWQEGKPYMDGIEFYTITDITTLENSLRAGDIDEIFIATTDLVRNFVDDPDFVVTENTNGVGAETEGFIPSSYDENSPFYDARVRQAMCYAIDSEALVNSLYYGMGTLTNQWAVPGSITYNPDVTGYDYNPEKAKELLAEAGYADGFDTVIYGHQGQDSILAAVADMLTQVGIRTEVQIGDSAMMSDKMSNGWDGIMVHNATVSPDLGLYMGRHLDPNGAFYAKGIQHPQDCIDLLNEIRTAKDDETKISLEFELQKKIYDEYALFGKIIRVAPARAVKAPYVIDDNYRIYHTGSWTPENAWLNK